MNLQEEIDIRSKEIFTDSYPISISELISIYKDGDLDIHPEFQRFYRWETSQKSRLIESLLLNFPIPPIFVNQKENGVWDIVDGLQRVSTILQFVGVYKKADGSIEKPLQLCGTKMLPSLEGKLFEDENVNISFSEAQRRYFKRAKINVVIIKKESDSTGKYEVFQRLNTGGSTLSDQEVRNCTMVMNNPELFHTIEQWAEFESFKSTLRISEKDFKERFDLELLTRFVCLRNESIENISKAYDFNEFLNDKIVALFEDKTMDWTKEERIFKETFEYINTELSDNAFSKYNVAKGKFEGGFFTSVFEIIAISIGRHNAQRVEGSLKEKVITLWTTIVNDKLTWKGCNASARLKKTLTLGDKLYEQD